MCRFQSGMFSSRDHAHRLDELVPGLPLSLKYALAGRRQSIEAASALPGLLDPRALDPAALLQAIEQHHLGLNVVFVQANGVLTPTLTGAQPAIDTVNGKIVRVLAQENDKAFALMNALDDTQRKTGDRELSHRGSRAGTWSRR